MIAAETKLPAERAHRFRLRRHAQPHALRDRQGVRRGRLQRHVRQADDVRPGPGRGAGQGRARRPASSSPSRTTTPAIRWCGRPARWSWPASWARSTPSAPSTSRAGCARGWRASDQKQAGWRTDPEEVRRRRLLRRHRHARLQPRPLHHRPDARQISCHLKTFEPGRELDDYGTAIIRYRQRRARHRDGLADLPRPRERPVDRGRRHQGRRWNGIRRSRTR